MSGIKRKKIGLLELEKRLMLDASLGGLVTTTVFAENTVNAAPQSLDTDVSVTGTTTDFDGESLDISTTGGSDDQLSINNEGSGAGQIGFDGTNVSYAGTVIGTVSSDGSNGSALIIDFDADASKAAIERLIENVTYANTSDDPSTSRTITFALGALFSEDMTVTVVGQNEGPSIDTNTGLTLNEGATSIISAAELGISDPDNADTDVTFTIDVGVSNGYLDLSTNAGVPITSFTLGDLNSGIVRYVHDASETTNDSFDFTVSDGSIDTVGTFNITVTPLNDTPTVDTNTGTNVFVGLETTIGADEVPAQFGTEVLRRSGEGQFATFESLIDNGVNSQIAVIFTTPGTTSNAVPGQVIYETGGSGRGIGLYLDASNELAWHIGTATNSPRMTSGASLSTNTQYAVIMEIDSDNDVVNMHYQAAGDFNWYAFGRTPENSMAWNDNNNSGGNGSGFGEVGSGSYGGFTGSVSGQTNFQGTLDSDLVITRFPSGGTTFVNTKLVATDSDSPNSSLIYEITTDVQDGQLYNNGLAIGLNDTFTQVDLDAGLITYTHDGTLDPSDSFVFSLTDGNTTLTNQPYSITVDLINTAPDLPDQVLQVAEDAANNDTVGTLNGSDPDVGQNISYTITGGTGLGIFDIDATSGEITVLNNTTLDYETTTSYTLTVEITDDATSPLTASRTFTIDILDVNENSAPDLPAHGPFSINENAANNDTVGTVTATDPEGDTITYSIVGGNTNNAFKINAGTGEIQVNDATQLDFETINSYNLTIRATDDDIVPLSDDRNVTVTIGDVNEGPSFDKQDVIYYIDPTVEYFATTDNFYKYINSNVNFATALDNSDDVALNGVYGHMVTITSAAENNFVDSILGNHIWIAASDAANEGQWVWLVGPEAGQQFSQGGTAVNGLYERWNGSEPNNAGNDFAYMNTNGQWYDQTGNENRRYVIEWQGDEVINNDTYIMNHANADASDLANGTLIGFVQAGDPDGDTITYSITGGNTDGIFEVDPTTGEVRILDNTNLDATIQDTYTLTIQASESGGGLTDTVNITVNFNNSLSLDTNNALAVNESATAIITNTDLNVTDADTPATDVIFTITTQPVEGQIELSTNPGVQINSFTQDDINNGLVVYAHNGSETTADSFVFSVTDGASTAVGNIFNIDVTPQNDAPSINVNTGTTIAEGGSQTITNTMLDALDSDDTTSGLTYTASNLMNGHIEVGGSIQNIFTQQDIDNGDVVFIHNGTEANSSFDVSLADGGEHGSTPDTGSFTLTRTPVNDAPVIAINNGGTVLEGGTVAIGAAELASTDIDDTDSTLIYTLSVIQNGQVELLSNAGVPIISFTQDDLNNNQVVFRHDGSENLGRFSFTVADGGEDYSTPTTGNFTFAVNPVNDSPLVSTANDTTVDTGNQVLIKTAVLNASDPDDSGVGLIYTVDSTLNGQLELLSNPNVAITTFTQADIDTSQLVFRHDGSATTIAQFQVTLEDGGENSATTDNATINFVVNNTNDSPTITLNAGANVDEGTTLNITTAMLDSFDPDDTGTGLTWTVSNVSANGYVALSSNALTPITNFTQADLDNNLVIFVHDGSETTAASFDVELADGGENSSTTDTATFNITVDPVNEAPSIITNTGGALNENSSLTITQAMLDSTDIDDLPSGLTYTVSNLVNGDIEVSGSTQTTFTQADINNGDVAFVQDGAESTIASFDITLADGGENSVAVDTATFNMSVTLRNDAPSIVTNTGATVDEAGSVVITTADLNEGDADDDPAGLTYTVSSYLNGHVEVNGSIQNTFTQQDIDNGNVVFLHDGSETTTARFDLSLADGGEHGSTPATGTFNLTVNPTSDAPSVSVNAGTSVTEGGVRVLDNTMLAGTDIDNTDSGLVYTISSLTAGQLENTNTANALDIGDTFLQSDIDNGFIRYTHDGSESASETFEFTLGDGTNTIAVQEFDFTVTPVNDDPTDITMSADTVYENMDVGGTVGTMGAVDVDRPSDTFTYTLLNDAGGMFSMSGNRLILMNAFDLSIAQIHTITVQVDDGNGGIFARNFDINVEEAPIDNFIAAREDQRSQTLESSLFEGRRLEDVFTVGEILDPASRFHPSGFITASLKGQDMFGEAFYGEARRLLDPLGFTQSQIAPDIIPFDSNDAPNFVSEDTSGEQEPERFTNIREVLAQLEAMNDAEDRNTDGEEQGNDVEENIFSTLEQEFEDVLSYHEMKKAKLLEALSNV